MGYVYENGKVVWKSEDYDAYSHPGAGTGPAGTVTNYDYNWAPHTVDNLPTQADQDKVKNYIVKNVNAQAFERPVAPEESHLGGTDIAGLNSLSSGRLDQLSDTAQSNIHTNEQTAFSNWWNAQKQAAVGQNPSAATTGTGTGSSGSGGSSSGGADMSSAANSIISTINSVANQHKPSLNTFTIDMAAVKALRDQLDASQRPALEAALAKIKKSKEDAIKNIRNSQANLGMTGDYATDERVAKTVGDYDSSEAELNAQYLADIGKLAMSNYMSAAQINATNQQSYNNQMAALGMNLLNGTIDVYKFITDDAYKREALAQQNAQFFAQAFGTIPNQNAGKGGSGAGANASAADVVASKPQEYWKNLLNGIPERLYSYLN